MLDDGAFVRNGIVNQKGKGRAGFSFSRFPACPEDRIEQVFAAEINGTQYQAGSVYNPSNLSRTKVCRA